MSIAGRARILLPAFVAAAAAALVAAFLVRGAARTPSVDVSAARESAPVPRTAAEALAETRTPAPRETAPVAPSPPPPPAAANPGVIRGEVLAAPGAAVPERWTLHVGPHPWLAGHETAADRKIEFEHGETTFELRDLPLGGYLVEAVAQGLNCLPGNVMLVRGSEDQFVTIQLSQAGFVDGGVLDSAGRPAEGLEVTLEAATTGERRTQTTDPAGNFLFREVKDGEYRILFGRPDSPLLPPQSLLFQAPSLRFPTRTLPPAVSLEVKVVDVRLRPVVGARISGSASEGGAIDTQSDSAGSARVRFLPPGTYRIDAHAAGGLRGSSVVVLAPDKDASMRIVLRDSNERRE